MSVSFNCRKAAHSGELNVERRYDGLGPKELIWNGQPDRPEYTFAVFESGHSAAFQANGRCAAADLTWLAQCVNGGAGR